jgi:protein phosphatase
MPNRSTSREGRRPSRAADDAREAEADRALVVTLPSPALVALVGIAGSGKSRFAAGHFRPTEVLSSDAFRAMISDDEADQSVSNAAFEVLHLTARRRLEAGRLVVVDATNVTAAARAALLSIAAACRVPAIAILLDVDVRVARRNDAARPRSVGGAVIAEQAEQFARARAAILGEAWNQAIVLEPADVDRLRVVRSSAKPNNTGS